MPVRQVKQIRAPSLSSRVRSATVVLFLLTRQMGDIKDILIVKDDVLMFTLWN